jgi:flagellar biosynthesis protein FlhB
MPEESKGQTTEFKNSEGRLTISTRFRSATESYANRRSKEGCSKR